MKYVFSIVFLSLISACSGGSSDEFGPECGANSSCPPPEMPPADSIVGLWDSSKDINGVADITYTEIGAGGEYVVHNYQQDENGSGENCYLRNNGRIFRYSDSSNYQIEFTASQSATQRPAVIFRQEERLSVTLESSAEELWPIVQGLSSSDLVLCQ